MSTQLGNEKINGISISYINDDDSEIGFHLTFTDNKVSGDATFEIDDNGINVNIDMVFKINVKPQHLESFLDPNSKWIFKCLSYDENSSKDLYADLNEGWEVESYKWKLFGKDQIGERYLFKPKTTTKKSDL